MSWIYYLLEANCYLTVFFLLYYIVFRRETYYQVNRAYLLISSMLAFFIPIVQLGLLRPENHYAPVTPVIFTTSYPLITVKAVAATSSRTLNMADYYLPIYLLVAGVLLFHLAWKIFKLVRLSRSNRKTIVDSYHLVETDGDQDAFSFLNYLFINPRLSFQHTVIRHELIHLRQRHSWDILFFELLKIINWFNPVVYMVQYSIKELHEFIADSETVGLEQNTAAYTDFLVENAYGLNGNTLVSPFFSKSLLKQRIIMLHQKRSGNLARLKVLLAFPVCGMLLCVSTVGVSKTYGWVDLAPRHELKLKPAPSFTNADTTKRVDHFTSKGYKYEETGYLVNNKSNFRVIITEKNGDQKSYFKNSATAAERAMLKQKYGYTFPAMAIYPKLPPPPPAPPKITSNDKKLAPPPPMPPARLKKLHRPVPPLVKRDTIVYINKPIIHPQEVVTKYYNDTDKITAKASSAQLQYAFRQKSGKSGSPLILVNGVRYKLEFNLKPGEHIYIEKADSSIIYTPGDKRAKQKWGADAENGVFELYGHPSLTTR